MAAFRSPANRLPVSAVPLGPGVPAGGRPLMLDPGLGRVASATAASPPQSPQQCGDRDIGKIESRPDQAASRSAITEPRQSVSLRYVRSFPMGLLWVDQQPFCVLP
jgi:hypothetical protein